MNQRIIELAKTIQAYVNINNVYPEQTVALLIDAILKPSLEEPETDEYFKGNCHTHGGCI